jgi:tRNA(Ile)-lysidine synthase
MPRSHPPTLLRITARTLKEEIALEPGARVLAAVSGGPDSMALLHVLAHLRARGEAPIELIAHGVDHGLRASAEAELDKAEALARALDVPFARTRVDVAPGSNLQARARAARYEALRAAAAGAGGAVIATAHHMEDRAETVLLRLLRGAGPHGLAVLPPRAGDLVRPFLRASRAAIDLHLERHALRDLVSHDPSNDDPRFARTRVRRELLPLMRELSPGIVSHLCALADQLGEARGGSGSDGSRRDTGDLPLSRGARDLMKRALAKRSEAARVPLPGSRVAVVDAAGSGKMVLKDAHETAETAGAGGAGGKKAGRRAKRPPTPGEGGECR